VKASIATLKRWSVRYSWQQKVADHDQAVAQQSMTIAINDQLRAVRAHFKLIDSAKKRYQVLADSDKPDATRARRKRVLKMTVSDYIRLLKAEDVLYKRLDRLERIRSHGPVSPTSPYTDEEIEVMLSALARYRHGLPRA
jgi:hypothetical protein